MRARLRSLVLLAFLLFSFTFLRTTILILPFRRAVTRRDKAVAAAQAVVIHLAQYLPFGSPITFAFGGLSTAAAVIITVTAAAAAFSTATAAAVLFIASTPSISLAAEMTNTA